MQKIERNLDWTSLVHRLSQGDRLEVAESVSLLCSAVGSIVAGLSGQVLFAATPLTLALWVNMAKRNRFAEQMRLEHEGAIADLQQMVSSVRTSVEQLPKNDRVRELEDSLVRISQAIAELEAQQSRPQASPNPMSSPELLEEFAIVRRAIVRLRDRTETTFTELEDNFSREIQSLRQQFPPSPVSETPEFAHIEADIARLSQGFSQIQHQVESLTPSPEPEWTPVQGQITQLQQQVGKLQQQNRQVVKPYLKHLTFSLKQLEKDIHPHPQTPPHSSQTHE